MNYNNIFVAVATTGAIDITQPYTTSWNAIDGIILMTGQIILVKDQDKQIENGIYSMNHYGKPLERWETFKTFGKSIIKVNNGDVNGGSYWKIVGNPCDAGNAPLVFQQTTFKSDEENNEPITSTTTVSPPTPRTKIHSKDGTPMSTLGGYCGFSPEDVDLDKVTVKTDSTNGWGGKPYMHRFTYEPEPNKVVPLNLTLARPCFSGNEMHPANPIMPHHSHHPMFGSLVQLNQELEAKLVDLLNKLAEKAQIDLSEHVFVTEQPVVYSVKCERFLDGHFRTLDALTCVTVNGVLAQPTFTLQHNGSWRCLCKIVFACVE